VRFELPARRRLIGEWVRCAATALVLFGCGIAAAQSGSPDILDTLSPEQRQQLIDAYAESRPMGSNDGSFEQYGSGEVPQARGSDGGSLREELASGVEHAERAAQSARVSHE